MRSATEINANKDIELTGNEANLVAYYKFNDGSGQIATDQSSTTNNAVLGSSNTAYTDDPTWVKVNHAITSVSSYRYGFNGMEKDNSVSGTGNSYTTEFRQYDPRLGRWLSLDPLAAKFPWQSPYAAFDNNPILIADPNGLAGKKAIKGSGVKDYDRQQKKAMKSAAKFDKKYEKFIKKHDGAKLSKDDFVFHSVGKKWFTKYEKRTSSSTNWSQESQTVKVTNPDVDFDESIPSVGENQSEYIFDIGISEGVLLLDVQAFSAPDRFQVLDAETGAVIFDTQRGVRGKYKTSGEIKFNLGYGTKIKVIVNPQGKKQGTSYYLFRVLADSKAIRGKMFKTQFVNSTSDN